MTVDKDQNKNNNVDLKKKQWNVVRTSFHMSHT